MWIKISIPTLGNTEYYVGTAIRSDLYARFKFFDFGDVKNIKMTSFGDILCFETS